MGKEHGTSLVELMVSLAIVTVLVTTCYFTARPFLRMFLNLLH
jgi:prepilin-type N-terminal cleavage/methylation domain-containing protein